MQELDEELKKALSNLQEGESFTRMEEDGEVIYYHPKKPTQCIKHEWEDVGNNERQCRKCGQGRVG